MTDAFEDEVAAEAEQTITIGDYLDSVEEEELEADLILGGDEGKECTYGKGYMKRQAIFSCLTCTPKGNAGICTACSLSCHEGHEVLELWTKRKFRCDCGNSKFGEFFCKLLASKDIENSENVYNHNFRGTYCTCDLPYPDPNVDEQVEMIQCCVCEDWFHEEHIGLESSEEIPRDEEGEPLYEDFICPGCSVSCSFLTWYPQILSAPDDSDKKQKASMEPPAAHENGESCQDAGVSTSASDKLPVVEGDAESEYKKATEVAGSSNKCIIGEVVKNAAAKCDKALLLVKNWRDALCRCEGCSDLYASKELSFLLDKEDSIAEYEIMGKQKRSENMQRQEGVQLDFLNNLGHVEKMEILNGIADIKSEIASFLEASHPSKPITTADVQQMFENLAKKRKRPE